MQLSALDRPSRTLTRGLLKADGFKNALTWQKLSINSQREFVAIFRHWPDTVKRSMGQQQQQQQQREP